jgi:hypothetical protein
VSHPTEQVTLLAATFPVSLFLIPWWGRFLVGKPKEESGANTVQLPDGTYITVSAHGGASCNWCV